MEKSGFSRRDFGGTTYFQSHISKKVKKVDLPSGNTNIAMENHHV